MRFINDNPGMSFIIALFAVTLSSLVMPGCGSEEFTSCWRQTDIVIDGDNSEWHECTTYFEDEKFAVGVMNDSEYLYIALFTADRGVQRQVMMSGMTVWLDVTNSEEKSFGVRFPLGFHGREMPKIGRPEQDGTDPAERQKQIDEMIADMYEFEIIGPAEGNNRLVQMGEIDDVQVAVKQERGTFIYELRVPLAEAGRSNFYGLGANPGDPIGIAIESPKFDGSAMRDQMMASGGMDDMGGGRGGGRGGGGGGGGRPGGGMEPPDPFDVWSKVQLATRSSDSTE